MALQATPTYYSQVAANTKIYDTKWGSHSFGSSSNTQGWAKCTYLIDYNVQGIVTFIENLNGVFRGTDSNGNPTTKYQLPMQCPIWPVILVSDTKVTPYGVNSTCNDTLISIEYEVANEILSLPGSAYSFADGTRGETGLGIPITCTGMSITRYRVPTVDIATFQSVAGCVSSASFFGWPAGNTLCDPLTSSTKQQFGGVTLNDVTYKFRNRSIPWSQALNPNSGKFEVYSPQTLVTADLNVLFQN